MFCYKCVPALISAHYAAGVHMAYMQVLADLVLPNDGERECELKWGGAASGAWSGRPTKDVVLRYKPIACSNADVRSIGTVCLTLKWICCAHHATCLIHTLRVSLATPCGVCLFACFWLFVMGGFFDGIFLLLELFFIIFYHGIFCSVFCLVIVLTTICYSLIWLPILVNNSVIFICICVKLSIKINHLVVFNA